MKPDRKDIRAALAAALILSVLPALARAAEEGKVANSFAAVAPYVGPGALGVARADLTRVDAKAMEDWMAHLAKLGGMREKERAEFMELVARQRPEVEAWLDAFRKAGGREVFVVFDTADLMSAPPTVLVPVGDKADAAAIEKLLNPGGPPAVAPVPAPGVAPGDAPPGAAGAAPPAEDFRVERIGGVVAAGTGKALKAMREAKGDANGRPDLAKALAAAGDAPVQLAVAPSADSRRVVEEFVGRLPDELGGGPATVITHGVRWASLAIQLPPKPELKLIIQSQDADAAKALSDVIDRGMGVVTKEIRAGQKHNEQLLGARPAPDNDGEALVKAFAALKPKQAGDRLELTLDAATFERIGVTVVGGPVQQQRDAARRQASASNLRQLSLVCIMWADEHKGEWPDKLEDAAKKYVAGGKVFDNPSHPGTGYTYVKPPARPKKGPAEVVVIYETEATAVTKDGKALMVAFMDGHVQFMGEDGLKAMLKEQAEQK